MISMPHHLQSCSLSPYYHLNLEWYTVVVVIVGQSVSGITYVVLFKLFANAGTIKVGHLLLWLMNFLLRCKWFFAPTCVCISQSYLLDYDNLQKVNVRIAFIMMMVGNVSILFWKSIHLTLICSRKSESSHIYLFVRLLYLSLVEL